MKSLITSLIDSPMVESLVGIERDAFLWLNSLHSIYLDSVMFFISDKWPWILFVVLFLFLMSFGQKKGEVILLLLGIALLVVLADGISSGIIKQIFQRARPTYHPLTQDVVKTVLGHRGGGYGFVSGHTANFFAFSLFASLVIRNRLFTIASFVVATTVAYSRIYLGMHFITDVLPGLLLGLACGWFCYWLYSESRVAFLDVPRREGRDSYLCPRERRQTMGILMTIFFILIWITAPFFFQYYS
ncbi:phosphatase PAP2 family protein [uncultured Porphyromonas sp.]|uniref:phosphatase PAP2 family protein n=1 Tax=uncultured Porphyromonas sp. TaxID=159274 RepID=UPI0026016D68|nr:phosphatase PAP2 family protein [uncultured Porphyromonas sp.]